MAIHASTTNAHRFLQLKAVVAALGTASGAALLLRWLPQLQIDCFAQGAARLASLLLGATVARVDAGWLLTGTERPVLVSAACSATDFLVIVAALIAWQSVRRGHRIWRAIFTGLGCAAPLAIGVNALRVVAVTQAHRWIIPAFPENYHAPLHLLTGVAIFLPALIALNVLLELHGRTTPSTLDHA